LVPLVDPWGLLWAIWGLVVDPWGSLGVYPFRGAGFGVFGLLGVGGGVLYDRYNLIGFLT